MSITYFIPDWDDRVDPAYDFLADRHQAGRDPYRDDRYAHELYERPPYDGILLSRAVLDANPTKAAQIQAAGSVHRYLRLPHDGNHTVLGDCGAFSYWQKPEPPYQTNEILDYYQRLGFDYGVSIDHLIFAELEAEKERRWNITISNAREFLTHYRAGAYSFTPIGVAQGWDPPSYRRAAEALVEMGYNYIAVGGLVRSSNEEIVRVLRAVQAALRPAMQVHLFGVSRPEYVQEFARLGVTSFDSASRLRRAWMDGRQNYFHGNAAYTAIRIPYAESVIKKEQKRATDEALADAEAPQKPRNANKKKTVAREAPLANAEIERMEQAALQAMRDYDAGLIDIEAVLQATIAYTELSGPMTAGAKGHYRATLAAKPWRQCACAICRQIGVEVIIFRGNNRNRRRGFHNTWHLYQHLERLRQEPGEPIIEQTELQV